MNKLLTFLLIFTLAAGIHACQHAENVSPRTELPDFYFEGDILKFLEENTMGYKYDSLLKMINSIPELRDTLQVLEKNSNGYTFLAVSDVCFTSMLKRLNRARKETKSNDRILTLDSLIKAPFEVADSVFIINPETKEEELDTIYYTKYDYRAFTDSVMCSYFFSDNYDTEIIENEGGSLSLESFKSGYRMNLACGRNSASGMVGAGTSYFTFSATNNSTAKENWSSTDIIQCNIQTNNGVIHVLSDKHEFGFSAIIPRFINFGNEYEKEK